MGNKRVKELLFDLCPQLRDEWDYEKNQNTDPEKLTSGSGRSAWWKCHAGHKWQARVGSRGKGGSGCAQCYKDAQLKINPLSDDEEIAKQLDDPRYQTTQLSRGSRIRVWWKCENGHRWESSVSSRCYTKSGCPFCSGYYPIIGETDLATLRPDLAAQWDDDELQPTEATVATIRKVWWKCVKGHRFHASIHTRSTSRTKGSGCPYCSKGRYAKVMVGVNDLQTLHPEIAAELYSTDVTAQELREYSNKKLEWKCSEGHIYAATVAVRVLGTGCVQCSKAQTSKIEGRLRDLIGTQTYLSNTVLEANHRVSVPWRQRKTMSVDIHCTWQGHPVVVEYDGAFWHHSTASIARDMAKTAALLSHEYLVVRIRENGLPLLEIDHPNLLQINVKYSMSDDNLEEAILQIEEWLNSRAQ